MKKTSIALILALSLSACGSGGSSSPVAPTVVTPPAPTVTSISISGLDAIRTGFFGSYTATLNLSNGTTQAATNVTWSTENASIAQAASNGDVTGVTNGNTNIVATSGGIRGTKGLRVVSNFSGDWRGTYRVTKCEESGAYLNVWCRGLGGVGTILPVSFSLTQSGNSRDQISGTIALGTFVGATTGNVTGDGRLILGAQFTSTSGTSTAAFQIGGFDARLSAATGMAGGWAHTLRLIGLTGNAYQENSFVSMTQSNVSGTPTSGAQRDLDTPAVTRVTPSLALTAAEIAQQMRQPQ